MLKSATGHHDVDTQHALSANETSCTGLARWLNLGTASPTWTVAKVSLSTAFEVKTSEHETNDLRAQQQD